MNNSIVIIVDAFSTGARLAEEFHKYDIDCLHIQSSENISTDFLTSYKPADFVHNFTIGQNFDFKTFSKLIAGKTIFAIVFTKITRIIFIINKKIRLKESAKNHCRL